MWENHPSYYVLYLYGKFHIVKTRKQLEDILRRPLAAIPEALAFISDNSISNPFKTDPATTLITRLNDTLKYLATGASKLPTYVIDVLEKILGMVCRKFDIQDGLPLLLFRGAEQVRIDYDWNQRIVETFNILLEYKKTWMQNQSPRTAKLWPFAVGLLAVVCSFHFLQNLYTENDDNPLTDEQKQQASRYFARLNNILRSICQNLTNANINGFSGNLHDLQAHLDRFEPFAKEMNDSIEAKIHALYEKKAEKEILSGVATIGATITTVITLGAWASFSVAQRFAATITSGTLFGTALHFSRRALLLREIIAEHKSIYTNVKSLQRFLSEIREYADGINLDEFETELVFWLEQFQTFRDEITEFQNKLQ